MPSDKSDSPKENFRSTWDVSQVARCDRYPYFHEGLCRTFLSFTPVDVDPDTLCARMRHARLPAGSLSTTYISPHRIIRTPADRARMRGEFVVLGHHLKGAQTVTLARQSHFQPTGDLFLLNANALTEVAAKPGERFSSVAALFPRDDLEREIGTLNSYLAIEGPYSPTLRACLRLIHERFDSATFAELASLTAAVRALLIAHSLGNGDYVEQQAAHAPASSGLFAAIANLIKRQAHDPELSAAKAAGQFGVSVRYIHKLFAARGTSFGRMLRETRLQAVKDDLLAADLAHLSAIDLSTKWGFRDEATFYRNFKARFGESPSALRARSRAEYSAEKTVHIVTTKKSDETP